MSVIGYQKPVSELVNKRAGLNAIYKNGANDLYPLFTENAILGSATGSLAHKMHTRYIAGVLGIGDKIINSRSEEMLSTLVQAAAAAISMHGGYFIHVQYKYDPETDEFVPTQPTILDNKKCRLNAEDDRGNWSKVFYDDFTKKSGRFKPSNSNWYYRYNPTSSAIKKQIKNDARESGIDLSTPEGIDSALLNYRGQVRYVKSTSDWPYTISPADSVLYDCVSEYFISRYVYAQTANGFADKQMLFLKKGTGEENDEVEKDIEGWVGIDNSGGVYVQFVDDTDDIEKMVKAVKLESSFNDEMFAKTETSLSRKILGAFDNLPEVLVYSGDGALFGTNPETFENAKKFYNENTRYLRELVSRTLSDTLDIEIGLKGITDATIGE